MVAADHEWSRDEFTVTTLRRAAALLGSARVSRASFGILPKRTLLSEFFREVHAKEKVRDRVDALASTLQACAPQT